MTTPRARPLAHADRPWVLDFLRREWGSPVQVYRGRLHHTDQHPGFVALQGEQRVGLLTYRIDGDECEISTLKSLVEGVGAGSALIEAVRELAAAAGCRRLWVITTNDNAHAVRFYQRRGFALAALHRNAVDEARKTLKPDIPLVGIDDILLRDEIELEMLLGAEER